MRKTHYVAITNLVVGMGVIAIKLFIIIIYIYLNIFTFYRKFAIVTLKMMKVQLLSLMTHYLI